MRVMKFKRKKKSKNTQWWRRRNWPRSAKERIERSDGDTLTMAASGTETDGNGNWGRAVMKGRRQPEVVYSVTTCLFYFQFLIWAVEFIFSKCHTFVNQTRKLELEQIRTQNENGRVMIWTRFFLEQTMLICQYRSTFYNKFMPSIVTLKSNCNFCQYSKVTY